MRLFGVRRPPAALQRFSLRSRRISAFSALNDSNAESAEIRRERRDTAEIESAGHT